MISKSILNTHYPIKDLSEVAEFLDNQRRPITASNRIAGPYPYYGANGQQDSVCDYIFDEPLILLAEDGGLFDEPDRGIAYAIDGKTWVNNHAHVLRPHSGVNLRYLLRVLENYDVTPWITGTTRAKLTKAGASKIAIPLPSPDEQKRIAGILDAADALRVKRRKALAQLDILLQSTFHDMFGDPVTNPFRFEHIPFHLCGKFISGSTPSKERPDYWDGAIPWVSPKDMKKDFINTSIDKISESALNETNIKFIDSGHILIVIRGMILAHSFPCAINTMPVTFNQDMKAIKLNSQLVPLYVLQCLKELKRGILKEISNSGHGTKKLDKKSMEKIFIPMPSLNHQEKFAEIATQVESQKQIMRAHLAELDTLFASLQHRAFNGEL